MTPIPPPLNHNLYDYNKDNQSDKAKYAMNLNWGCDDWFGWGKRQGQRMIVSLMV